MAIIEVSIVPVGTASPSLSRFVARAVEELRGEPEVKYELTAMGTIIEGELDRLLPLVKKMHESPFSAGAVRVVTVVKIDERRDTASGIATKVASVEKKLRR